MADMGRWWACVAMAVLVGSGCGEGEEARGGTVELGAQWPSEVSAAWALVDGDGERVVEGEIDGGEIAMMAVEPGNYEVRIVEEVVDAWENPWGFQGVEESFEVGEGARVNVVVKAQAPTVVVEGADEGAYGSLREVVDRVHRDSLIEISDEVEEVELDAPLVVGDRLRLMGHGRHESVIRASQRFEPSGGALIEVAPSAEEVEVRVRGVAMNGAPGVVASGMVVDGSGKDVQIDIAESEWGHFDGALVLKGEGRMEINVEGSRFLNNGGVDGGAIRANGTEAGQMVLRIEDGYLDSNEVTGRGGAIYLGDGVEAELKSMTFVGNRADGRGGAVYVAEGDGAVAITGGSWGWDSTGKSGGAGYFAREVIIDQGEVHNCHADAHGGGMFFREGRGEIRRSVFKDNEARHGGALALKGVGRAPSVMSQPVWGFAIEQVLFEANEADAEGGAIHVEGSDRWTRGFVDVDNATFSSNAAGASGGGIYWGDEAVGTVNFSTFVDNECGRCEGGGPAMWVGAEAGRVYLRAVVAAGGRERQLLVESGGAMVRSGGRNHFDRLSGEVGGGFKLAGSDVVGDHVLVEGLQGEGYRRGHPISPRSSGNPGIDRESCQRHRLDRLGRVHRKWNPTAQNDQGRPVGPGCLPGAVGDRK